LANKIEKLENCPNRPHNSIGLVAKDIQSLGKTVKKELKKLKSPRRKKIRIGFQTD